MPIGMIIAYVICMILNISNGSVLIDATDYDSVIPHKWNIRGNGYASATLPGERTPITLHRFLIKEAKSWQDIDHIDRNRLNNQRSNLRICTVQQSAFNKAKFGQGLSSKYKGVSWSKKEKKFYANITFNYLSISLFSSNSEEDCAYAYNIAASFLAKEFALCNDISTPLDAINIETKVLNKLKLKLKL